MKAVNKVVRGLTAVELVACALTFAIMVICYFISVVNRNIIKGSMPWTEELAVYSMVYMALLGTELGLRDGTQVSVTALTSKLEGKTIGKILDIIARLIVIYFVYMMFRNGNALVAKQLKTAQTTPVMKIPMYTLYLSLSISFCLTLITQVLMLIGKLFHIPMEPITKVDDLIDTLFGKKKKEADNA
ncbi:MAG: TRAP transporter small permease [Oscillospiraceae bacterium]|nr:TRAP transporter small permease [Oscillospiraceae bacterium]MBR6839301.1 TRAP transporter small permease [Oscillospiraceae bacterium]